VLVSGEKDPVSVLASTGKACHGPDTQEISALKQAQRVVLGEALSRLDLGRYWLEVWIANR
jgi:hypothetical protein